MNPTYALLGLLGQGERHGYDLKRTVDQEFAPFWRIDFAQLYRSLAKMKRNGWIHVHVEPGSGGPDRKMYSLTTRGRQAFEGWLQEPAADRDEFFVKLRLANTAGIAVDPLVDAQRKAFEDEQTARQLTLREARAAGDAGRILLADAALGETEAALAAVALWAAATPSSGRVTEHTLPGNLVITGSDDPLLTYLARLSSTFATPVGSLGGLEVLSRHEADVAGVHLLDLETGEYNVPFVKHLLPEETTVLINLAFRENGLIIARGNPKQIRGVRDLTRGDVRLINRQRGTGTRLLLYGKLRAAHIDPHSLPDWEHVATTHEAVAAAIATGAADAGPGLSAVAVEWNLDFIPLGEERYDLVIPQAAMESERLQPLLDALHSTSLLHKGAELHGYDLTRTGRVIARLK